MPRSSLPDLVEHFKGYHHETTPTATLAAGAGSFAVRRVPSGFVWKLDTVSVGGPAIGGARVTLYRGAVADDTLLGTVLLGATDPGAVFSADGSSLWLRQGENLLVAVSGSGGASAVATVWYRLYELRPATPAVVPTRSGDAPYAEDQPTGRSSRNAPTSDVLDARDPIDPRSPAPARSDGAPATFPVGELG